MHTFKSSAMQHLTHLCQDIGPRPVGSTNNQAAAEYIHNVFEAAGFAVELQEFNCPVWEVRATSLTLQGRSLTVAANGFSPPCDVMAPAVAAGTVAELEAVELTDRIGIMYGDLTKGTGYGARSGIYYPEEQQRVVQLVEAKRPAALITVHSKVGSLERLMRDCEFPIPSATVPAEVGLELLQNLDSPLHLKIDSSQKPSQFSNVVATKTNGHNGRVVLLAHFDTMRDTPGAVDNSSGVAVLLALAEHLAKLELGIDLEWLAVNGEEMGGLGDVAYMSQKESELEQVLVAINVDGVGQCVGANSVTTLGGSKAFQAQIRQTHQSYPGIAWVDPWYESDHSAFLWRGVPCIALSSVGVTNINHMPSDTAKWIHPTKLDEVVDFITQVIQDLQDQTSDWSRETKG